MSQDVVELQGTLQPDGTLVLDEKPDLPPGRVEVVLRPAAKPPAPPQEDWWQFMQRARRELEARGYPMMTEEEVNRHIEWLRGDDDRIDEIYRQIDEQRQHREQQEC
jgi:hypothetical protein